MLLTQLTCREPGTSSRPALPADCEAVLFADERCSADIGDSLALLQAEMPSHESAFVVLVPRAAPPMVDAQYEQPTSSFLCSASVYRQFLAMQIDCFAETVCFAILRAIADGDIDVDRLLVRQIPYLNRMEFGHATADTAIILPHRGSPSFLRSALKYICRAANRPERIMVGLDVDDGTEYAALAQDYPEVDVFRFSPAPVGPYVIRQALAERSLAAFLTLQDSDDLSSFDRFALLHSALAEGSAAIVGSHELCIDEIRCLVQPVRFPLNSSAALRMCTNHALLHATLMCRRETFFHAGGLATDQIIASDTQFLLRAFFRATIRNVDEFLYIRRRHATSLTNAPETIYDNPLRRRLGEEWTRDFNAVKQGELALEASTLWPQHRTEPFHIEQLT